MQTIKCMLGLHDWHKYRYETGATVQSYEQKQCEHCQVVADGFAKKNHPFFRKMLGMYSEETI